MLTIFAALFEKKKFFVLGFYLFEFQFFREFGFLEGKNELW
jgi:hypothetical protein